MVETRPPPNDATAQTLNYALGNLGGKQKSWMASAAPTIAPLELTAIPLPFAVRGRGRPRKQPASAPGPQVQSHLREPARPSASKPLGKRLPSSNSTSPQLANLVAPQPTASDVTVLPSPTPSEEIPTDADTNIDYFPLNIAHSPNTSLDHMSHRVLLSKRPVEGPAQQAEKRSCIDRRPHDSMAMAGTPSAPSPVPVGFPQNGFSYPPSAQQSQNNSPLLGQVQYRSPSLGNQPTPPSIRAPAAPSRPSSRSTPRQATTPIQPQNTSASGWYTLQQCLHIFHTFQSTRAVSRHHPRDEHRLEVLRDAVEMQDWPYLTMHQYYCMLTVDPSALPPGLKNQLSLANALNVMYDVLDSNQALSPPVLHFFANYPFPAFELATKWPSMHGHQLQLFLTFVFQSPNYGPLRQVCERRRIPPLARELSFDLAIASLTFQRLMFTAIFRSIWRLALPEHLRVRFEAHAVALFGQNQIDFNQQQQQQRLTANSHLTGPQQTHQAQQVKAGELQVWGSRLHELLAALQSESMSYNGDLQQQPPHASHSRSLEPQRIPSDTSLPTQVPTRPSDSPDPHSAQAANQQSRGQGRPPVRLAQSSYALQSHSITRNPALPLIPVTGWTQPQQRLPNPTRFSLHQAHLQSPILRAVRTTSPLYQAVLGYIKIPMRLTEAGRGVQRLVFNLTPSEMQLIPQTLSAAPGEPGSREVSEKSRTARLRCIKWASHEAPKEHAWAVTETVWIPHSHFKFNGTHLQLRKKVHHGKDLPIDITGLLKTGENVLEVAIMAQSNDKSYLEYLVAIEVVRVSSHESIKRQCLEERRIPADQILGDIKRKLAGPDDDDELRVVESNLTIGLFDPFGQSKICEIPVRGTACPHNDCFDLEIFLQTRPRNGDVSVADQWRCPICKADARPQYLVVDGFIESVREQLEAQGLSQTRHIVVQQDGSWKPKAEVREGVSDRGASDEPPTPTMARAGMSAYKQVIDLSD